MMEANKGEEKKKELTMTKAELEDYIRTMPEDIILVISFVKEEAHV